MALINLVVLGLIFEIVGVFILTLITIFDYSHQRVFGEKEWWKKYWWQGWRPVYRNTQTFKWKIKWNSFVVRYGFVPPKHQWNIVGFSFILVGFLLQLKTYING